MSFRRLIRNLQLNNTPEECERLREVNARLRAALEAICDSWEKTGDVGTTLFANGRDALAKAKGGATS